MRNTTVPKLITVRVSQNLPIAVRKTDTGVIVPEI
jgi:hypothetical protein